jgi:hypothetical protein
MACQDFGVMVLPSRNGRYSVRHFADDLSKALLFAAHIGQLAKNALALFSQKPEINVFFGHVSNLSNHSWVRQRMPMCFAIPSGQHACVQWVAKRHSRLSNEILLVIWDRPKITHRSSAV